MFALNKKNGTMNCEPLWCLLNRIRKRQTASHFHMI